MTSKWYIHSLPVVLCGSMQTCIILKPQSAVPELWLPGRWARHKPAVAVTLCWTLWEDAGSHSHSSSPGDRPVQSHSSMPLLKENILLGCFLTKTLPRKHLFWPWLVIYSMEKGSPSNRCLWGRISQIQSFDNNPEIHRRGVQRIPPELFRLRNG